MYGFAFLLGLIGALHLLVQIPLILATIIVAALWVVWKLRYVILAVVGLNYLFGRGSDDY